MKKKYLIILFLFSCVLFTGEKDDICEDGAAVTPQLIITFYDNDEMTEKKNVENLYFFGLDESNEPVIFENSEISTTDSIAFPLRTDINVSKIVFFRNAFINDNGTPDDTSDDDIDTDNQDIINFNYTREEIYVSRACGFKMNFLELSPTLETDADNWILGSEIINPIVENEISAHVKIYH